MGKDTETILRCVDLRKSFGATAAVDGCSLEFREGTITGIIGPNGAGKTTLFGLLSGFVSLDSGKVYYRDRDITELCRQCRSYALAELGIAQSFQLAKGFGDMTILESLMVPPTLAEDNSLTSALRLLLPGTEDRSRRERERQANAMLSELGLEDKKSERLKDQDAGTQKLVELGQIFLLDPSIFLLDEPFAGVSGNKVPLLMDHILRSKEKGKTTVMIEHKMESVLNASDVIYVLVNGQILACGSPDDIRTNETVIEAYLGGSDAGA
jgi:ABC-type branched-subunit amino acid transport system ATPase component